MTAASRKQPEEVQVASMAPLVVAALELAFVLGLADGDTLGSTSAIRIDSAPAATTKPPLRLAGVVESSPCSLKRIQRPFHG